MLAAILATLTVDAAVETFWHGSVVRWIVLVLAVMTVLPLALLWRRARRARVTIGVVGFASLLVIPAWLQGGLDDGVQLLGLSTSTVLSVVAASAVVIAMAIVGREARLPRVARWVIVFFGAYGVVAFAQGVASGVSFRALMAGGSFWRPLPYFLQGTMLGGLLVLAVALIVTVVRAGVRQPGDENRLRAVQQAVALVTALSLFNAALPFRPAAGSRTGVDMTRKAPAYVEAVAAPNGKAGDSQSGAPADDTNIFQLLHRSEHLSQRIDPAEWQVSAKAAQLQPGIDAAFTFVRDRIRYEPYGGVLRGAAGTYASRAGNAEDRSLLLAELLRSKGIATRFAVGTLSRPDADRLFLRAFDRGTPDSASDVRRLDQGDLFYQRLFRRASRDYRALRAALGDHLMPVAKPSHEDAIAEMNPHVWLQARVGTGWVDLDPSLADSTPGRPIAVLDRTNEELADDQYQHVTVRVVMERLVDGALVTSTCLDVTRRTVDLIDTQVVLLHTHPRASTGLGGGIVRSLGGSLGDRWIPTLWIGGDITFGKPLDAAAGDFVAEHLEFELTWPDGRREVTRRTLIDRGGPAWRAGSRLDASQLRPVERDEGGALAMQALHNIWFSAGRHRINDLAEAARTALLDEAARAIAEDDIQAGITERSQLPAPPDDDLARQIWPFVLQNFASIVWTDNIILPLLDNTPGVRLYAEAPRITIFSTGPAGAGTVASSIDFRRDEVRGIAIDSSKSALLADKKVQFAALQAALEHETLAELTVMATGEATGVRSTSSMLAGRRIAAFARSAAVPSADRDMSIEIDAALRDGRIIVAAAGDEPAAHAWWEVLPGTGNVRPIAESGLRGSRTPPIDRNNPFLIKRKIQQNPWGGQKVHDLRSKEEIREELYKLRRAEAEEKATAEAANYKNSLAQPQQAQGRGGGSEYAVLVTIGTVVHVALKVLSYFLLMKLFEQIELVVSWLADGALKAAWP